jgi:hypothetical protein
MTDLPDDLEMRTVVFRGDIDDMGVVITDLREERVQVKFADREEWVARDDLEDVTDLHDLAYTWGLTDENQTDEIG